MPCLPEQKSERIHIRTSAAAKRLLQQAAAARSPQERDREFLLEHGLIAASETNREPPPC